MISIAPQYRLLEDRSPLSKPKAKGKFNLWDIDVKSHDAAKKILQASNHGIKQKAFTGYHAAITCIKIAKHSVYHEISPSDLEILALIIKAYAKTMDVKDLRDTIGSLKTLWVENNQLAEALANRFITIADDMLGNDFAYIAQDFAWMNLKYEPLSKCLQDLAVLKASTLRAPRAIRLLNALTKLNIESRVINLICDQVIREISNLSFRDISLSIDSIDLKSTSNIPILKELESEVIYRYEINNYSKATVTDIYTIVSAYKRLEILNKKFMKTLSYMLPNRLHLNGLEIKNLACQLAKCEALDKNTRRKIDKVVGHNNITMRQSDRIMIAWSFAMALSKNKDLFYAMLSPISIEMIEKSNALMTSFLQVIDYMQCRGYRLPLPQRDIDKIAKKNNINPTTSAFQNGVTDLLTSLDVKWEKEYLIGYTSVVDIAIKSLGLVIECDGPYHNLKSARDRFKDFLISGYGWKIKHIDYRDWEEKNQLRILNRVLQSSRPNSPELPCTKKAKDS